MKYLAIALAITLAGCAAFQTSPTTGEINPLTGGLNETALKLGCSFAPGVYYGELMFGATYSQEQKGAIETWRIINCPGYVPAPASR